MANSLYGDFSDQDSFVVSGQVATANNNQITLNAALAESDHLRAGLVSLQPVGLTITPGERVPNVVQAVQSTIGAALSDTGQSGTASQEPGGGGIPCFLGHNRITMADGLKSIADICIFDMVLAFDKDGKRVPKMVTDTFQHLVQEYMMVAFPDGHIVDVTAHHRYWQKGDIFTPIKDIDSVWHWESGDWVNMKIVEKELVKKETIVYNFTVADLHTYICNGDAVSNLKPLNGEEP